MTYPTSDNLIAAASLIEFDPQPTEAVEPEDIGLALAGVIETARTQGLSLNDLTEEVLADDMLLDPPARRLLSEIVAKAWHELNAKAAAKSEDTRVSASENAAA
jgi:hypothetical protein